MNINRLHKLVLVGLCVASLQGCTNNTLIVANPTANKSAALAREVAGKCALPADQRGAYATPIATSSLSVQAVEASRDHVNGCASARFHLDVDGNVTDVEILSEYPKGEGYGEALSKSVMGSKYKPPVSPEQWYYLMIGKVYNPNASSQSQ